MDSSGSPGTATFGNDSSSGSTGVFAVLAIADPPDTQQSASSGISHDRSHSSWKEVGHAVWSRDGEKKRSSSASLSTPRRSVKGVMSPVSKEKGRSKSPTGSNRQRSPKRTRPSGRKWKRLRANWLCYRSHMSVTTVAMLRAFRNWNGELVRRNNKWPISSKDPTNNIGKLRNTLTFNVGRQNYPKIKRNIL